MHPYAVGENNHYESSSPASPASPAGPGRRRSNSMRFDASKTMDRLRTSMIGEVILKDEQKRKKNVIASICGQIPAIALIGLFHLMIGIPFGKQNIKEMWLGENSLPLYSLGKSFHDLLKKVYHTSRCTGAPY
jgi:hypothetical protein